MNTSLYLDLRKNSPPRYPTGRTAHPAGPIGRTAYPADPIGRPAHPADPIRRTAHPALCQPLCLTQTRACFIGRRWLNERNSLLMATWMKTWNSDHEILNYNRLTPWVVFTPRLTPWEVFTPPEGWGVFPSHDPMGVG